MSNQRFLTMQVLDWIDHQHYLASSVIPWTLAWLESSACQLLAVSCSSTQKAFILYMKFLVQKHKQIKSYSILTDNCNIGASQISLVANSVFRLQRLFFYSKVFTYLTDLSGAEESIIQLYTQAKSRNVTMDKFLYNSTISALGELHYSRKPSICTQDVNSAGQQEGNLPCRT